MTTVSVRDITVKGYVLSVTTRYQTDEDTLEHLEELTFRTVESWLFIADLLERNIYEIKAEGSIESRYQAQKGITLKEHFGDSRVTVWSTFRGAKNPNFHLNSDDNTQVAINTWLASRNAVERILAKHADQPAAQNAPQTASNGSNSSASPATPITPQTASQAPIPGVVSVNGKAAAKALPVGQQFSMKIVKIEAVFNKKGTITYELFCAYGANPGKFADLLVYADNPHSINSGLVAKLEGMGIKPQEPRMGQWFVVGNVYQSGDKVNLGVQQLEPIVV